MRIFRKIVEAGKNIGKIFRQDQLAAFAAQAAFFMLLSVFPFAMLLLTTIKYLPFTKDQFMDVVLDLIPEEYGSYINYLTQEIYTTGFGWTLFISAVLAIWSASRGTMAVERGLNFLDRVEDTKNYFLRRGLNALHTLIFCMMLILVAGVYILGNSLIMKILDHTNLEAYSDTILFYAKLLTGPVIVFGVLLLIFHKLPDTRHTFMSCIPGAVFSTIGWIALSIGFSYYVEKIGINTYTYGSLASIILVMLWLYLCMYILFLGAELNKFLRKGFWEYLKALFGKRKARRIES